MKQRTIKDWILATRPWSFPASAMPVAVTIAYLNWSQGDINLWAGVWALVNIVIFHAAGNTWSDYADYKQGVDAVDTHGATTLTSGQFKPAEIRNLSLGLFAVAVALGFTLLALTGWELIYVGTAAIVCTLLYPPLKFHAWGDACILTAYGIAPTLGTAYVCTGVYDPSVWVVALPVGLITVAILHSNNTRDVHTDARAGIKTFAMLIGQKWSVAFYLLEVLAPYLFLSLFAALGVMPWWVLTCLVSLPIALGNCRQMLAVGRKGLTAITNLDELTAKLQLSFSAVFVLSLVVAAL